MKLIWNLEKTIAIQVKDIKEIYIYNINEEWYVEVAYKICTGKRIRVLQTDTKNKCINWIGINIENTRKRGKEYGSNNRHDENNHRQNQTGRMHDLETG